MTTDKSMKLKRTRRLLRSGLILMATTMLVATIGNGLGAAQRSDREGDQEDDARRALRSGFGATFRIQRSRPQSASQI